MAIITSGNIRMVPTMSRLRISFRSFLMTISLACSYVSLQYPNLFDVPIDVELSAATVFVHVADLPEDRQLLPGVVMEAADGPGAAGITVGVPAVQFISVVQRNDNP
jgi:hypothetical protein